MKRFICFCVLIISFYTSSAQNKGCQVGPTVYTSTDNLGLINSALAAIFGNTVAYKPSPSEPQTSNCVNNSQTKWISPAGACRVCPSGYNVLTSTGCNGVTLNGSIVTKSVVYCNLDDYTLPLVAVAGTLGLFMIRRRKLV